MPMLQWLFTTFNSRISAIVLGQIRTLAATSGGYLVAHGYMTNNQLDGYIGSVCFLGAVGFSALDKLIVGYKLKKAAATGSPTGTP